MKIKEGGVMDIHELRQFESVYKPSKEVAFCWLRKQYVQLSTEENHTEIVDHANDSLRIWQAAKAKAQAVPEGFVLVKMDDLELLRDSALKIKYASLNNDSDRIFSDIEDIQLSIERLIELQEPAND